MELNRLIEALEEELTQSRSGLFSKKSMVDTGKCLSILAEIRESLPEELSDMGYVLREAERMRRQASEQAALILREAESKAAYLVDESNVVKNALAEAEQIKKQTKAELERLETASRDRLDEMLFSAERALSDAVTIVRNSRARLEEQKAAASSAAASRLFEK